MRPTLGVVAAPVLALAVAGGLAAQQFEGVVTIRTLVLTADQVGGQSGGQEKLFGLSIDQLVQLGAVSDQNVMQVKGGRMRTAPFEMPGLGSAYMVLDGTAGVMRTISPSRRGYYEISLRAPRGEPVAAEADEAMTIEPLGETRVINGLRCTGYRVTQGEQVSRVWTTSDPLLKGLMLDQLRMAGGDDDDPAVSKTRALLTRYGAPVMSQELDDEGGFRVELWSLERQSLPDSLFAVPAGFSKLAMPGR
jgi:Domain of unknown function (DUF4412)